VEGRIPETRKPAQCAGFFVTTTNGAYFFFLAPPFFAAFFFFAAIVLSMERVLNAGPIPRWIGRQQPDANIRLVPRAELQRKLRQLDLFNQQPCEATNRRTIEPMSTKRSTT
jgi:hypothetical protein